MTRSYAGIGSRSAPKDVLDTMRDLAAALARKGYLLRSGGADGADTAFEQGACIGAKEIFVPWPGFNSSGAHALVFDRMPGAARARQLAAPLHPRWEALSPAVRKLMARNVMQVLGRNCSSPVDFVVCWAPGPVLDEQGRVMDVEGGTGLAVRLAYRHDIPVFHLGLEEHARRIKAFLVAREPA